MWYHVLRGAKRMYLAPPTEKNLDSFKRWTRGSQREKTFAEYLTGKVCAVDLHEGDTLIIPSGWIHAVYTPVDSMVFGGNFLTMSHVPSPRRERAHSNAQSPPGSGAAPADVHANVKPVRVIE